jgi:hypothetical protein
MVYQSEEEDLTVVWLFEDNGDVGDESLERARSG